MNKNRTIPASELILNPDGSIYHLNLLPSDIAETIILVGDPKRVPKVSQFFDRIDIKKEKREFVTHTGYVGSTRLTVLSTGIGAGNIEIVMHELDALCNIDFDMRKVKENLTSLKLIRLGTSGSIHPSVAVDSVLLSEYAVGLDAVLPCYGKVFGDIPEPIHEAYSTQFLNSENGYFCSYLTKAPGHLNRTLFPESRRGITITAPGFYAPQGRKLRLSTSKMSTHMDTLHTISIDKLSFTNLEMETAAIFGLSQLFGFEAASINCILANRINKTFSSQPKKLVMNTIERLIGMIGG